MESELKKLLTEKLELAEKLIRTVSDLKHIRGTPKFKKMLIAEKAFLLKVSESDLKVCKQSNITHFNALVSTMLEFKDCSAVLETFLFKEGTVAKRLVVDVVANNGQKWIKVIARNPKSLIQSCLGDTNFGNRTVFHQVLDFKRCAEQNKVLYTSPEIVFKFSFGIDSSLASKISSHGITVMGELLPSTSQFSFMTSNPEYSEEESDIEWFDYEDQTLVSALKELELSQQTNEMDSTPPDKKLNLDITALIAYVTEMTNGGTCLSFKQEPLTLQAQSEQSVKVKERLDQLFEGRKLYCCETALKRFSEILETVGGVKEKQRAKELLNRVIVVPDCVSERVQKLKTGGQIKERARIVFGTGDFLQAVTVSANLGFCRAAYHQGVHFATFLHEPRALSEQASIDTEQGQQNS